MNYLATGFIGVITLVLIVAICNITIRIIIACCECFKSCYKCFNPDDDDNIWNVGCCCFHIYIDCSPININFGAFINTALNIRIHTIRYFIKLKHSMYFHCCNQWGCMAKLFGCRFCRKNIKKIVPVKKNYSSHHIIIINPYDDQYKIGTVSKVLNV